ncbi:MAG: IPT/TIG domain-containing protein [Armatimonadetes bacterium]|nr:IPT/TIG domain-containing protein [Armatimonadota bacterium]
MTTADCRPPARWTIGTTLLLCSALVLIAAIPWLRLGTGATAAGARAHEWLLTLALVLAFVVVAGHGLKGVLPGAFIDSRNHISLSRFQLSCWTAVVISAWVSAVLSNLANGNDAMASIGVRVPQELWYALGISNASLVGKSLIQSNKQGKSPDTDERASTFLQLRNQGVNGVVNADPPDGLLVYKQCPADAQFSDMFRGEETGNAATLDLGKVQMFFFTVALLVCYAFAVGRHFYSAGAGLVTTLPALSSDFVVLLGISHAGYLSLKAAPHSREDAGSSGPGGTATTAQPGGTVPPGGPAQGPPTPADPQIVLLSPATGAPGDSVTLTGQGFGATQGGAQLRLDNVPIPPASVRAWDDTHVDFLIPRQPPGGQVWQPNQQVAVAIAVNGQVSPETLPLTILPPASGAAGAAGGADP